MSCPAIICAMRSMDSSPRLACLVGFAGPYVPCLQPLRVTREPPLGGKQPADARTDLFMGNILPAIERLQAALHGLDETSFVLQVKTKHFLRQLIRVAPLARGKFAEFRFLLRSKVDFHNRESRQLSVCCQRRVWLGGSLTCLMSLLLSGPIGEAHDTGVV